MLPLPLPPPDLLSKVGLCEVDALLPSESFEFDGS